MRFIKTFESFDSTGGNTVETKIKAEVNKMNAEDLSTANTELSTLADKLRLNIEDLQDAGKVEKALSLHSLTLSESDLNEGLTEWWARVKTKAMSWMTKIGITGIIGSIAVMGVGAEMMDPASEFTSATVTPSATVLIGITALMISIAATMISNKLAQSAA